MASAAVMTAVETRLAANWSYTEVRSPNSARMDAPADGSAFLVVQYPSASEEQLTTGSPGANFWREEGAFRFVLNIPIGQGYGSWASRMDALRQVFRGKVFDGISTFEATPPIDNGDNDDGNYYEVSFSVAYWYDITG